MEDLHWIDAETQAAESRPYYLSLLAEACTKEEQTAEGLEALAEALASLANSRVRLWEADLQEAKALLDAQA